MPLEFLRIESKSMITTNDNKTLPLWDLWEFMGPKRRTLLNDSWAGLFREEILPILPVKRLAACYDVAQGRPGKDLYTGLGVLFLQQYFDLTDLETVEQLAFNVKWHYAFNLTDEGDSAKYMCPRTLWKLRNWAVENGLSDDVFQSVVEKLAAVFSVDTTKQRLDSVHTKSNMKRLGRIRIFSRVMGKFLQNLKRHFRGLFDELPEALRTRYLGKSADSIFSMVKPSESEKTLLGLGKDLHQLVERFKDCPDVARMTSYQQMQRVLSEQCTVASAGEGEPVEVTVKLSREISSASLQNPSDPDAGYSGHKGQGYSAQVMETYSENKEATTLNLLTYAEVEAANISDAKAVVPAVEAVEERGMAPETLLADSLYGGDENIQALADKGVELVSPVMGQEEKSEIKLSDFEYGEEGEVVRCPLGQAPVKNGRNAETDHRKAQFEAGTCRACPRRAECPVKPGKKRFTLHYTDRALRSSQRRAEERTEAFKGRYRFRSGIEATMSQLDRRTGLKHLRVRGLKAVRFCVKMKVAALNLLRAAAVRAARRAEAAEQARAARPVQACGSPFSSSFEAPFAPVSFFPGSVCSIFKERLGTFPKWIDFPGHAAAGTAVALPAAA